ncbi:hypothetical protein BKA70DRAFT_173854 [Coprinopsis sp. MPI-PUGE-AT-0042]|nr:hypothetical protein BKA70DRAFT_173854 [Coprinopsis sp. MPI-PUGE-AT-0042]
MTEYPYTGGRENPFSPSDPPQPSGQNYDSPLPSELSEPCTGLDINANPHQPFRGVQPPPQHPPWLPTQISTPSTTSAAIPTSTAGLFQGGSDNALHNSTASTANRDVWNLSNVHIHLPHGLHSGQGPTSLPQLLRQPLSVFSYVLSTFATLIPHTTVTVDSQQYEAPCTMVPSNLPAVPPSVPVSACPDPNVFGSENNNARAAEGISSQTAGAVTTAFGNVEITLLDDLDMSARHQPRGWYRSPDHPGGLSMDGIYIKRIYPSGHGYPCPNPCPLGPPVRIGDIGELTSAGFTTLANLANCQLPALQSQLASLALSDVWHEPEYFSEGQSITGGVSVQNISYLAGSRVIQNITYRCHAPQGAILAVTSPAQLHTLAGEKIHRLRGWLCKHGAELLQFVDPGRTDPLYVITGKVTSSSWANATYSEHPPEPDNLLVLTHFLHDLPPYHWTKPGTARNWSKSSSKVVNPQGERASDQCLFLRGFLLTPAPGYTSSQAQHALNIGDAIPDPAPSKSHSHLDTAGGALGQGSSQFTHFFHPTGQSGGMAKDTEENGLLVEDIPSLSSMDFYPSHQINKQLLELTNADLAITHDDDWRLGLEGPRHPSLSGLQESIEGTVPGDADLAGEDSDPVMHVPQDDRASWSGKQEGVRNWAQEVSKHKPVNPFIEPADRESDFHNKSKSGARLRSSPTSKSHKLKPSGSHKRSEHSESSSDEGGLKPIYTPPQYKTERQPRNPALPQQAAWPSSEEISPPSDPYPQQRLWSTSRSYLQPPNSSMGVLRATRKLEQAASVIKEEPETGTELCPSRTRPDSPWCG